jgi:hypothetical protein
MLHVYAQGKFVAMINKQSRCADGFDPEVPWLLLYNSGRVERCATQAEARDEALKSWSGVTFKRAAD